MRVEILLTICRQRGDVGRGLALHLHLDQPERRPIGKRLAQERGRHVINRYAAIRASFECAVVGVAVHDGRHWIAVERLFQAAAAEKREDLDGLALDGLADW